MPAPVDDTSVLTFEIIQLYLNALFTNCAGWTRKRGGRGSPTCEIATANFYANQSYFRYLVEFLREGDAAEIVSIIQGYLPQLQRRVCDLLLSCLWCFINGCQSSTNGKGRSSFTK